ncbi:MAG: hypothetical protein ACOX6T_27350 [Myxococcales bacterium]
MKADLERAEKAAKRAAPPEVVERIARMKALAGLVERAVEAFLRTARFDVTGALGILAGKRPAARRAGARAEERGAASGKRAARRA